MLWEHRMRYRGVLGGQHAGSGNLDVQTVVFVDRRQPCRAHRRARHVHARATHARRVRNVYPGNRSLLFPTPLVLWIRRYRLLVRSGRIPGGSNLTDRRNVVELRGVVWFGPPQGKAELAIGTCTCQTFRSHRAFSPGAGSLAHPHLTSTLRGPKAPTERRAFSGRASLTVPSSPTPDSASPNSLVADPPVADSPVAAVSVTATADTFDVGRGSDDRSETRRRFHARPEASGR